MVRGLHEVVQQAVDSETDVARALSAAEQFSHDSGCTHAVFITSHNSIMFIICLQIKHFRRLCHFIDIGLIEITQKNCSFTH